MAISNLLHGSNLLPSTRDCRTCSSISGEDSGVHSGAEDTGLDVCVLHIPRKCEDAGPLRVGAENHGEIHYDGDRDVGGIVVG